MGVAEEAVNHVSMKATSMATYSGAGSAVYFGLTANEIAALGGLAVAVVAALGNLLLTWHFKSQHLQLARARAETASDGTDID